MIQRCLALARQAAGRTAPNPMVGSVIVKEGVVIGEGFHPKAGEPHAEVFALRAAGEAARGGTLYVNLEPCSHHGRTPPCADAVIQAGIRRVVVGMVDPNPLVAGNGIRRLEAAGIVVTVGIEAEDCQRLNEAFIHRMQQGRPFGILKYAMTLDGRIAASTGHSQWITAPPARSAVHQLRSEVDAIIVGGQTVRSDNPNLTTHGLTAHGPLRVVISQTLDLPQEANLWEAGTVVFGPAGVKEDFIQHLRDRGVEVVMFDTLSVAAVMENLYQRGCLSVLWECGGRLSAAALQAGAVQKVWAFIAPKIIGGIGATPIGELGISRMDEALILKSGQMRSIGEDWLYEGYL
ncbi:MAG: bifunctional diaminohydroxyphosphoribosylaminopyrimidine deaminase/5-amino-6-(5-phosphoribosylamino)uracil reductase RibD [Alkalinema sp. RU_4_3]|nr:bifunctional diaminohydroxyphosphoribosylaminopyrimidine deaminase/5-amino-6-(5-phosphoribosylamino)uracil reductase RibD [Alkalinema sp. RU_4_3]